MIRRQDEGSGGFRSTLESLTWVDGVRFPGRGSTGTDAVCSGTNVKFTVDVSSAVLSGPGNGGKDDLRREAQMELVPETRY